MLIRVAHQRLILKATVKMDPNGLAQPNVDLWVSYSAPRTYFMHFSGARAFLVSALFLVPEPFWRQHFSGARAILVSALFWC
jgi:hypothetical protein